MDYDEYLFNEYILNIAPYTQSLEFREIIETVTGVGFTLSFGEIVASYFGDQWLATQYGAFTSYYEANIKAPGDAQIGQVTAFFNNNGLSPVAAMVT